MELSMANRRAITKAQAVRYRSGSRAVKSEILAAVCAVTGFNRDYARSDLKRG
jgi:protein-disulfide isomerase-like protein with CxxC motif